MRRKNLHLRMHINFCCQHRQLFSMNVLRAEKHYFNNNYKLFIVNLSNLVFSVSPCPSPFVELPNRVQFLCLSGDDLTLSVCYKKGNFTTMALF